MKHIFYLLPFLIAIGCSQPQPGSSPQELEDSMVTYETLKQKFPLPVSFTSGVADSERPDSAELFRAEFIRLFETDIYAPFIKLGYWDGSNDQLFEKYLEGVFYSFVSPPATNRGVIYDATTDVTIETLAEYGDYDYHPRNGEDSIVLFPEPTHILGVEAHLSDSTSVVNHFAVGKIDGKFYFSTIVKD